MTTKSLQQIPSLKHPCDAEFDIHANPHSARLLVELTSSRLTRLPGKSWLGGDSTQCTTKPQDQLQPRNDHNTTHGTAADRGSSTVCGRVLGKLQQLRPASRCFRDCAQFSGLKEEPQSSTGSARPVYTMLSTCIRRQHAGHKHLTISKGISGTDISSGCRRKLCRNTEALVQSRAQQITPQQQRRLITSAKTSTKIGRLRSWNRQTGSLSVLLQSSKPVQV